MAVNRIEPGRLTYHDKNGDSLYIETSVNNLEQNLSSNQLMFTCESLNDDNHVSVLATHDAVETIIESLKTWLETGSLEIIP